MLGARMFYLQVIQHNFYRDIAKSQHTGRWRINSFRGDILDSDGRRIATSIPARSIYIHPREISDVEKVSDILSERLNLERTHIEGQIRSGRNFAWVRRKVDPQVWSDIEHLRIRGIGSHKEPKRVYPFAELFGVSGFGDIDSRGIEGLEKYWDSLLSENSGYEYFSMDGKGRGLGLPDNKPLNSLDGWTMVTSLNALYQTIAYEALKETIQKTDAKRGFVIVGLPDSGRIIAFAQYPSFDPNNPSAHPKEARRIFQVTDIFEPGSTFKIVTAAAAVEQGVVQLDDRFYCEQGVWNIGRFRLRDHDPFGWLTFKEIMEQSSNIGIAKIAELVGADTIYKYIRKFGFGRRTGIDIPGEVRGIVRPVSRWSKTSHWAIPIGQEVGVNGVQLWTMIATIANRGMWVRPRIADYFQSDDGRARWMPKRLPPHRVISERTADAIEQMLLGAVERGTGVRAKIPGVFVAGKTGTAQKIVDGRYSPDRFVASFVGYVRAGETAIACVVVIDEPRTPRTGGAVAAPVFREILQRILHHKGIPFDNIPVIVVER
jgi:cell division protein FtsI (penicillin-binding protein 3)